jgi:hypothetical protein
MTVRPATQTFAHVMVFLFGFAMCMLGSRWGMHPLDSSIVFDGAWRILHGQSFFDDFSTPNGFVPIGMQVIFFKILGVNWWAYRIHAAVINGLFALLALGIVRRAGASLAVAVAYAMCSALVFYLPMGVPYMEQHAYFFVLAGIYLVMAAGKASGRWRFALMAAVPATWAMAILSKQSPGFFAIPLCAIALPIDWKLPDWRLVLRAWSVGLLGIPLVFILFVGWPLGIEADFWRYFWVYPSAIGAERAGDWSWGLLKSIRSFAWLPFQTLGGFDFVYRWLLYFPFVALAGEWVWRKWRKLGAGGPSPYPLLLLGIAMIVTCSFFMHSSQNQKENGLPLVFVAVGLGHIYWSASLKRLLTQLGLAEKVTWRAGIAFSVLMLGLGAWNAISFDRRVNASGLVLDFQEAGAGDRLAPPKPGIAGLGYMAPFSWGLLDPGALLQWLDRHPGNFLLMGDLSCLYGLSGRPSVAPFLWMHAGLALPRLDDPAFSQTDAALLRSMETYRVRFVIFEHPARATYMGLQLECFPLTADAIYARYAASESVGGFTVWYLGD